MTRRSLLFVALLLSCRNNVGPDGKEVGGNCQQSIAGKVCDEVCLLFGPNKSPPGMCSMNCRSNSDCPGGTQCVSTTFESSGGSSGGGYCAVPCANDDECALFSRGFICTAAGQPDGKVTDVCFNPTRLAPFVDNRPKDMAPPPGSDMAGGDMGVASGQPVPGMLVWLRADSLSLSPGATITTWNDQSGNSNDATQATSTRRPTFQTNVINGLPAARFDGVDDRLGFTSTTTMSSVSVFIVYRITTSGAGNTQYPVAIGGTQTTAGRAWLLETLNSNSGNSPNILDVSAITADARATLANISSLDTFHILSVVTPDNIHGTTVRENGRDAAMSTIGTNTAMMLQLGDPSGNGWGGVGGSNILVSQAFKGDVAEVIIYSRTLSSLERQQTESYLNGKYQIF